MKLYRLLLFASCPGVAVSAWAQSNVTTPGGTTSAIPSFNGSTSIHDSGVTSDNASGLIVPGNVNAGSTTPPAGTPLGTVSAPVVYVPGLEVSVTAFGAKCDWTALNPMPTNDTTAFNAAWASIQGLPNGGTIILPAAKCYVPNGLNFSTSTPSTSAAYVIRGQGKMASQIITKNANIGLDIGGQNGVQLEDFMLTDVGTTPNVGVARYRVHTSGGDVGSGGHIYRNFAIQGAYQIAALYSIASENNNHYAMDIYEYGSGAGLSIDYNNCLGMTGQGQTITTLNSDTVNHFFGGFIIANTAGQTGGAVLFCNGSADDVAFNGTYLLGESTGYNVRFGQNSTDNVQGSKTFRSVRFEGTADSVSILASTADSVTIDGGSTFGELSPGIDINYTNTSITSGAGGMEHWDVHGNSHLGNGVKITAMTSSRFEVGTLYQSPGTAATIITVPNNGFISESEVRADGFSFGSNTSVGGSILTQSDNVIATGSLRTLYGPNNPTDPYNSGGSVFAMRPFGTAPQNPVNGEIAMADCNHWVPITGCTTQTIVQYNAATTSWQLIFPTNNPTFTGTLTVPTIASPSGADLILQPASGHALSLNSGSGNNIYFYNPAYSFAQHIAEGFQLWDGTTVDWRMNLSSANFVLQGATSGVSQLVCVDGAGTTGKCTFAGSVTALGYTETLTTPASSSATCTAGQFTDDANYHYVCTATNTWKRVALSSF